MKKWMKRLTAAVLGAVLVMGSLGSLAAYGATPKADEDMRAVWISTVYSADYPSTQNNAEAQKAEFIKKLDQSQALGLNTVVVQVRPKGDAFYESDPQIIWQESILTGF